MSSMMRRSKLSLRESIQPSAQTMIETHGAPLLSFQAKARGRNPSSAMARGRREYDMVSELRMPAVLISAPITTAKPSHGPAIDPAKLAQLPVAHAFAGTCAAHMATTGIAYEKTIANKAINMPLV